MAPFPESESMTVKRLEVALRKKDMQLLKDGAYKLHEKFHTGHRFEFTQELGQIRRYVDTHDIALEIREILCPTIDEILKAQGVELNGSWDTSASLDTSSLDAPSIQTPPIELKAQDIKLQGEAYEEYMNEKEAKSALLSQSTPVQEFIPVKSPYIEQQPSVQTYTKSESVQQTYAEPAMQTYSTPVQNTPVSQTPPVQNSIYNAPNVQTFEDVAVFYDDAARDIDYNQIKEYRNNLNNLFSKKEGFGDYNILREITSILNIADIKIFGLDKILSTLSTSKNHVSLITTSQSQEITKILCEKNIDFEIPFVKKPVDENNAQTLIPMLGFSNIFVCSNCNARSLKTDFSTRTLSVQCPNCDSAAFPDVYAINSYNPDCNPIFWHRAFRALIKAKVWIIVNPPLDENKEVIFDFFKTVCDCASPKRIYMLSKESDKKEFYRQMFAKMLPDCDVRSNYIAQEQLCEDYIKVEITDKVYA